MNEDVNFRLKIGGCSNEMLVFREGTCHKIYRPFLSHNHGRRENDPILRELTSEGADPSFPLP